MREDFAIFILTHGRPNKQYTNHALDKAHYTGKRIMLLDDEDDTVKEYKENYPDVEIILFDKQSYIDTSDTGTNKDQRKCILYAKNAANDIAKDLGFSSYVVADDDIIRFRHRWKQDDGVTYTQEVKNMDAVIEAYIEFLLSGNISALSFGDARLYMGGKLLLGRIPYNFVFRNTAMQFEWRSAMYEDTVTPVVETINGTYTLGLPNIQFDMKQCDNNAEGGMSDVYAKMSIYERAFTAFMYHPPGIEIANNSVGFELIKNNVFPNLISTAFKK